MNANSNAAIKTKPTFSEVINFRIDAVDDPEFPGMIDPNGTVLMNVNHPMDITDALATADGEQASREFYKRLPQINELFPEVEIEVFVTQLRNEAEFVPQAIGFAQGLRAAGMPRRETAMMLRGYLRRFEKGRGIIG